MIKKSVADTENQANKVNIAHVVMGIIFAILALYLSSIVPSAEIAWVSAILFLTMYLFIFEVVGIDVTALTIMVILGLTSLLAPYMGISKGLVDNMHLFDGFSSNAVISIIAVMILGAGLDKTGIMTKVAAFIMKIGGTTETRIVPIISGTVGVISSFIQNVGAAALFLPVVSRISAHSKIPMARLLMPMGFTAIVGGTMTMVGSSPLILLNDLIETSNKTLTPELQMDTWSMFSVTPIGLALVITVIIYFVAFGRYVLPETESESNTTGVDSMQYFHDVYGTNYEVYEVKVLHDSSLIGHKLDDIETINRIRVIAKKNAGKEATIGTGALARDTEIKADMTLGIVAEPEDVEQFITKYGLVRRGQLRAFVDILSSEKAGIAEVVIPPGSDLIGQSARDLWLRKFYGIALIGLHRNGKTMREGEDIRNIPFQAGDTLVVHTAWQSLTRLKNNRNFVVVTTEYPHEEVRPNKVLPAISFFLIALAMVLFTDIRLSVALLTGAVGMILSGVLTIDEAYGAVSWKTVFLLASLIPLGMAVESSGTAKWIAEQILSVVGNMPVWFIQAVVAALATFFTLVMSNVGATVLLVPLAINIAIGIDANPAVFALTVAIATSNSFIIPTHQVNALIMGPAGYRVPDFMKAGGIMTVLYLVVMITAMNVIF